MTLSIAAVKYAESSLVAGGQHIKYHKCALSGTVHLMTCSISEVFHFVRQGAKADWFCMPGAAAERAMVLAAAKAHQERLHNDKKLCWKAPSESWLSRIPGTHVRGANIQGHSGVSGGKSGATDIRGQIRGACGRPRILLPNFGGNRGQVRGSVNNLALPPKHRPK